MSRNKKGNFKPTIISIIIMIAIIIATRYLPYFQNNVDKLPISLDSIPEYSGSAYVEINNNQPFFTDDDLTATSFEKYSDLDSLKRCGVAYASIGIDIMPTEPRGSIGSIKPTAWQSVKYDFIDGKYLYNRCHLIAFQLAGENANEKNLITGTRYMNTVGMIPFENMVADYVKDTENHVLYRVTPIFKENNLLASGVLIEAKSVEDRGEGICFCVYVYNVQPGVIIDYSNGNNKEETDNTNNSKSTTYILNTNTHKFHKEDCDGAINMKKSNKQVYNGSRNILIAQGYTPCSSCNP